MDTPSSTSSYICGTCGSDKSRKSYYEILSDNRNLKSKLDRYQRSHLRHVDHRIEVLFVFLAAGAAYWLSAKCFTDSEGIIVMSWLLVTAAAIYMLVILGFEYHDLW
ncbi:Nn.00g077440.m01.CDS01 [Neocucurbitaria sp. VM-36]